MDQTITRAASGETALTAPKDSQSQAKGQKSNEYTLLFCLLFDEIGKVPISFYLSKA